MGQEGIISEPGGLAMALRERPYIPLYVQDFLTDEKLIECSAESTGVYIRLMCIMHKSQEYGTVLLKQKDKQTGSTISDFALKLARQMPYDANTIERSLRELLDEEVLSLEGDVLSQKRMVKDGKASDIKALAGSKGGKRSRNSQGACTSACDFAQAESQANTEYEIESENETAIEAESEGASKATPEDSKASRKRKTACFEHEDKAYLAAVYLDKCICARLPGQKGADERRLQAWAAAFDKCHRLDGQEWDSIARVLKFSQEDPFWQGNILSAGKFREKYTQLLAKMQAQKRGAAARPAASSGVLNDLQALHAMFQGEDSG